MKRYLYSYYLNDLLVCDMHSVLDKINTLTGVDKHVVEDHVFNYRTVIALGICPSMEKVNERLEKVRQTFIEYNKILDEYNVNLEMRFDVDDLPSAVSFHRELFFFMEEDAYRKAIKRNRERIKKLLKKE